MSTSKLVTALVYNTFVLFAFACCAHVALEPFVHTWKKMARSPRLLYNANDGCSF